MSPLVHPISIKNAMAPLLRNSPVDLSGTSSCSFPCPPEWWACSRGRFLPPGTWSPNAPPAFDALARLSSGGGSPYLVLWRNACTSSGTANVWARVPPLPLAMASWDPIISARSSVSMGYYMLVHLSVICMFRNFRHLVHHANKQTNKNYNKHPVLSLMTRITGGRNYST